MIGVGRRRRQGIAGAILIALVLAAAVVAMALSQQASSTRAVFAAQTMGRLALELVESAIDECLADFPRAFSVGLAGQVFRDRILGLGIPVANGPQVVGLESWRYAPGRTFDLVEDQNLDVQITPVTVRPIYYSLAVNHGEVELSASALFTVGRRAVYRQITSRHYMVVDGDGSIRVNPVGLQKIVDRSAGE